MSRVRVNVVANMVGGAVNALLGIVLVPVYLRYVGSEGYGLVGFHAMLTAVLSILDGGLALTLNRAMARYSAVAESESRLRNALRTIEVLYWPVSALIAGGVFLLAPLIQSKWVSARRLADHDVVTAIRVMGIIVALQLLAGLYQAGLVGLQRQLAVNSITTGSALLRGLLTISVLAFVSPTIVAFFITQACVTLLQAIAAALTIRRELPPGEAKFDKALLRAEWAFTAAIGVNVIVGALLTQTDKVVLSAVLPLQEFGYYVVAATVASSLGLLISPIHTAIYPRFTQLLTNQDDLALRDLYHAAAQFTAIMLFPVAAILTAFGREVLLLWTGDAVVAASASRVAAILVAGTALNGVAGVAVHLALAAGWLRLTMLINPVSAVVLVPASIFLSSRYGAVGAASVWLALNAGYVLIFVPIMHRRLLPGEKWRWYTRDVLLPLSGAASCAALFRAAMPHFARNWSLAAYIATAGLCTLTVAALLADQVRRRLFTFVSMRHA
ncbi:MAG TPA: oligosaccharide flippase family protein [Thermoanaerobaculia bacterium]|jgi:O-antigen/teichoic acid export membrane protein